MFFAKAVISMHKPHKDEIWEEYRCADMPAGEPYFAEIKHDDEGTGFILECIDKYIVIRFNEDIRMYLYSDEGMRMASYAPIQEEQGDKYYFRGRYLFLVNNSRFLEWAMEESCGAYAEIGYKHFCIVTENELIDLIAASEPFIYEIPKGGQHEI